MLNGFGYYKPTLDDQLDKLKSSGRKPSDRKRTRRPNFESAFDRLDKKKKKSRKSYTFQDPNSLEKILYELFFRSMVPCLVNQCKGICGISYFRRIKSHGRISFMNKQGEMNSKYCPLYINFKAKYLKEYARRTHDVH